MGVMIYVLMNPERWTGAIFVSTSSVQNITGSSYKHVEPLRRVYDRARLFIFVRSGPQRIHSRIGRLELQSRLRKFWRFGCRILIFILYPRIINFRRISPIRRRRDR